MFVIFGITKSEIDSPPKQVYITVFEDRDDAMGLIKQFNPLPQEEKDAVKIIDETPITEEFTIMFVEEKSN